MRIALDATYSVGDGLTGVGVYSREILHGLARAHPESEFVFCYRPHRFRAALREPVPPNVRRRPLFNALPTRAALFHALNQRVDTGRFPRVVSTFHDLFVLTAEYSTPGFRARFAEQARGAAARSDLIVAVSEFTARQVEHLLGVPRARIRVIHHGVHLPAAVPPPDSGRENLILHVGAIQTRKNIVRLVQALEAAPIGWRLALAGSAGYGAAEILLAIERSPRRSNIDVLGYVSDAALGSLYQRARIFAFPSLDEGFGMPVLDAMANGIPVITSNSSALPEVAGGAAWLVDPRRAADIANALARLTADPALRGELRGKGLARAEAFTWGEAVSRTWAVYKELLGREQLG
ncbi:MAG: glycosyltransferase family 1 protein [Bryobacteraceae bacterium]